MAATLRIDMEAEGSIGTVLFCHFGGHLSTPSASPMLRIGKPPAMERFPHPFQRSLFGFGVYVIAQSLTNTYGVCYTTSGQCFLLSMNYEKRPHQRVIFSVFQPEGVLFILPQNVLNSRCFVHLRLRPDRDGPPELPAPERRAGRPDAEAHRRHGRGSVKSYAQI